METFAIIYAILIIVLAILIVKIIKIEKENILLKKVFFKSDNIYWNGSSDISYSVSLSMTKDDSKGEHVPCDFISFRRNFLRVSWKYDRHFDKLQDENDSLANWIHAGILKIDGVGYLPVNLEEYRKIVIFIRWYIDYNFK